jgi:putative peptidoglycan lipid II flippase
MSRILLRANKSISFGSTALLLAGSSLLGALLGILRTKLVNANFINFESDAYFAAFKIPDFVFFTLASGALGVAFLPILSERLLKNKQSAWQVASYVLNGLALVGFISAIIIMVFARPLLHYIVVPGFIPEQLNLAVAIMRIISVNIFLFSISTVLSTVQQATGRFFFFAVAPLFYNGAIIASIYLFGHRFGVVGLSLGIAIGAILQLLVIAFGMAGLNFRYRPYIDFKNKSFQEILRIMPARSIDQGIDNINSIVETRFASHLSIGSVTNYENALVLYNAPVMLIGNAISTAAFPRLTNRLAEGKVELFKEEFLRVLRTMIWISLPVVVISFFARGYLARIIFARSNQDIATIFGFLCVAIFFRIIYTIVSRYFYANKDTKTPLYVSIFVILLNILLAWRLSKPSAYGIAGLAIAQSIVAIVEVTILIMIMAKRDHHFFSKIFLKDNYKTLSATGFSALTALITVQFLPLNQNAQGLTLLTNVTIIALSTFFVHILVSYLFEIEEAKIVVAKIRSLIFRRLKMQ